MKYKIGQLVVNNKLGLGKILDIRGDSVTTFFKNEKENPRTINVGVVPMELAEEQNDPWFDCLDENGKVKKVRKPRATKAAKVPAAV